GADGEIDDLIDDQQRRTAEVSDALAQATFSVGLGERIDDVGERREVDAATGADGLDAERRGQVTLSGAGLADEVDHLMTIDEVELRQCQNLVAVERRLEREVEAGQRLDGGKGKRGKTAGGMHFRDSPDAVEYDSLGACPLLAISRAFRGP